MKRGLASLLLFCLVTIAFSWPLAVEGRTLMVSRQFDLYSLVWLVHAVPSLDGALLTPLSAWPLGQRLVHADSFLLVLVAKACQARGTTLAAALALVGPVLSAWAAERLAARHLGIPWPWSIIAGLSFGFSGLQLTALLEGHVYAMLCPWIPLLAWAWAEATRPDGRTLHGVLAGVLWALCLLTSAYTGIVATLLLLAWVPSLWRGRCWRALLAAAAVALPVGLAYLYLFTSSGGEQRLDIGARSFATDETMAVGSARLGTLVGWTPGIDLANHSIAPMLGFTVIALCLFAWPALRGRAELRPYLLLAIGGVVLSLGPELNLFERDIGWPWVLLPLTWLEKASFFHFPARLLQLAHLGMGVLAAASAAHIARSRGRVVFLVLATALADVLLFSGALQRTARIPVATPSAYAAAPADRAVLELLPDFNADLTDEEMYLNNLSCSYQAEHGRSLLNLCLGTQRRAGPRWEVSGWLMGKLLVGETGSEVAEILAELGIGAVVVRPDLFQGGDREALLEALEVSLGPPSATSRDGGEYLQLYSIPEPRSPVDPVDRYLEITGPGNRP
ncbi:MAG TPA: hypothetical protein QGF58_11640 [Myxococcota bacterium]|nr:hypothetical protein [Myxococcota bacterium]